MPFASTMLLWGCRMTPPSTSRVWYDHPYVRLLHTVLTGLLVAGILALFSFYAETQKELSAEREQMAVICSKVDLIYKVVVEDRLSSPGNPSP